MLLHNALIQFYTYIFYIYYAVIFLINIIKKFPIWFNFYKFKSFFKSFSLRLNIFVNVSSLISDTNIFVKSIMSDLFFYWGRSIFAEYPKLTYI